MQSIQIRKPTVFDVQYLAENARLADKEEVFWFNGGTIQQSLNETQGLYDNSCVLVVGGKLVCIYGMTPFDNDVWGAWLLATDEFDNNKKLMRKLSKNIFREMSSGKRYMFNFIWSKHKKALAWVKWLGFRIGKPVPMGLNGELFCMIEMGELNYV